MKERRVHLVLRGILLLGIYSLSGCAAVAVDSAGNRHHSGLFWVRQGTADHGQTRVVEIKSLGVEAGICPTGAGAMVGYGTRVFAWPNRPGDSAPDSNRPEEGIDDPKNGGRFGFNSVTIPALRGALLHESSQTGVSLSTCADYPVVGLGYRTKTQVQYERDGKMYSLHYVSGKAEAILFHENCDPALPSLP